MLSVPNERTRLAIGCHEAAHAVVAHALGNSVSDIRWEPGRNPEANWSQRTHADESGHRVACYLAGYIVTKHLFPGKRALNRRGAAGDFEEIAKVRAYVLRHLAEDTWRSMLRASYEEAQRIVLDEWHVIVGIAIELCRQHAECGRAVLELNELDVHLAEIETRRFRISPWAVFRP